MTFTILEANSQWARIAADTGGGVERLRVSGLYDIGPGFFGGILSRAQLGSQSTALSPAGVVQYYGADVPRFNGAARRLLIEGQRTNSALQSATMGTAPWTLNGTVTLTPDTTISPDGTLTGDTLAITHLTSNPQCFQFVTGGAVDHILSGYGRDAVFRLGFGLAGDQFSGDFSPGAAWGRFSVGITGAITKIAWFDASGGVDTTPIIWGAQWEQSATFPSSYIPTTTTALTRGRDVATFASQTGARTITGVCMIPQNAPAGAQQVIWSYDDGTDNNRYTLRNSPGGAIIQALRVTAGVSVVSTDLGSMTAGTPFRFGMTIDGAGAGLAAIGTGPTQTIAGGPTVHTTGRAGSIVAPGVELFGEIGNARVTAGVLTGPELLARMAATPLA